MTAPIPVMIYRFAHIPATAAGQTGRARRSHPAQGLVLKTSKPGLLKPVTRFYFKTE